MNSDLAETVILGEGLIGRVLELLRHRTGPPPNRVVVDVGKHKFRTRFSLQLTLLISGHLHNFSLFRHVGLLSLVPMTEPGTGCQVTLTPHQCELSDWSDSYQLYLLSTNTFTYKSIQLVCKCVCTEQVQLFEIPQPCKIQSPDEYCPNSQLLPPPPPLVLLHPWYSVAQTVQLEGERYPPPLPPSSLPPSPPPPYFLPPVIHFLPFP